MDCRTALAELLVALESTSIRLECMGPSVPLIELLNTASAHQAVENARTTLAKVA